MTIFGKTKIGCIILASAIMTNVAISKSKQIEVQGHRGARSVLPENSLPALRHALELNVDTLEFDMGVTKDGVVVVVHDQKINPVICQYQDGTPVSQELWIHELTLAQVKAFDCGSKLNPRFPLQTTVPGTQIPSLAEVFDMVTQSDLPQAKTVLFNIETKSDPDKPHAQPEPEEFVKAVLKVVNDYDLADRVCLQSFDHRTLIAAHKQAPNMLRAALFRHIPDDWVQATLAAKADIVSPYFKLIDKDDVTAIHKAGLRVIPWTANTNEEWEQLVDLGVDGIITDDPEPLLEKLGRR